ncbi:SelB C-terminal domain-containing protein [Streptomyces sp. NBC_00057]
MRLAPARLAPLPQPFTVSAGRRTLGTSRRVAVPLFELLDRLGHTGSTPDGLRPPGRERRCDPLTPRDLARVHRNTRNARDIKRCGAFPAEGVTHEPPPDERRPVRNIRLCGSARSSTGSYARRHGCRC